MTAIASKLRALGDAGLDGRELLTAAFGCYRLDLPEGTWVDPFAAASGARDALAEGDLEQARAAAGSAVSLVRRPFLPGEERHVGRGEAKRARRSPRARAGRADRRVPPVGRRARGGEVGRSARSAANRPASPVKCKGADPPVCRSAPCYRCSTGLAGTARGRRRRGCRPGDRDVAHVAQTPSRRSGHRSDCLDPRCTRRHRPRRQAQHHESTSDHR